MSAKRIIKKSLVILISTLIVVVVSSVISTFFFKDELINHFIREANKQLNTPINIGKIHVSALDNFPRVTLGFDDVYIQEGFKGSSYPLLEAKKVEFTFNPIEVFQGNYTIQQIHITDGSCHLKMNEDGEVNYTVFKKADTTQNQKVRLDLSKVTLKNVDFKYSNLRTEVYIDAKAYNTSANVSIVGKTYNVSASGDYLLRTLLSQTTILMEQKEMSIDTDLVFDDLNKHVNVQKSTIETQGSPFTVYGDYHFLDNPTVEFYLEGKDTNIQTLVSLLPDDKTEQLKKYESKGGVYLDLVLKGENGNGKYPSLTINFGLNNAELYYPEGDTKVENANAEGLFIANSINDLNNSTLQLRNISGKLEGKEFESNFTLRNFEKPWVSLEFDGDIDIRSVFELYKTEKVKSASGTLAANITLEGNMNDLKSKTTAKRVKTSGEINLTDITLNLTDLSLPFEKVSGNLLFNNNDLAISDVNGLFGSSDFKLNGFFKNIVAFLLFENEPVGIEADLKSDFVNLDELLSQGVATSEQAHEGSYEFSISPRLILKFNCDVKRLQFRRFKPTHIKGDLKIKNQIAFTEELIFRSMGGSVSLSGMVDATARSKVNVSSNFKLHNINADSAFFVFENFNQTFLQDKHLKGKVQADVDTEMSFTNELRLLPATLTANISTSIVGGELHNFEPMQQLARYLDEDKLDHLTFSELRNDIHIENKTIYLPQMEVRSNVTEIKISGTHTFDQHIDYRVIAPLRSQRKIDKDEAFGAIEEDNQGRTMLYLKILGTTSDYRIVYDKAAVKDKIVKDLKKEVNELKEAFKNKGLDKKNTIELKEDDYFDWDDDDGSNKP